MTHKEDYSSEFDIYLSDILDRLREKYGYASVNRIMRFVTDPKKQSYVKFFYSPMDSKGQRIGRYYVEIPNSEIEDCIKSKTLPKEIKELL